MSKVSMKSSIAVSSFKKDITKLAKSFDVIVKRLRETPMTKAEYDTIESLLVNEVLSQKNQVEQL